MSVVRRDTINLPDAMNALRVKAERSVSKSAGASTDRVSMYDQYGSMAYGIILQIIPQHELAQNVLVDLFASPELEACAQSSSGSACYIIRLARAKALDARNNAVPAGSTLPVANEFSSKSVFGLSFYQGFKPETIAEQLNVPYRDVLRAIRDYFQYLRTS